ncbi:hypothetical protein D3C72_1913660 [compost metagenome]
MEEQHPQARHGERLDQPVDRQGDDQPLGPLMNALEAGEIHRHHHRVDHQPDQHRDYEVDRAVFITGHGLEQSWKQAAQANAGNDTERDPDRQVALEKTNWLFCTHARTSSRRACAGRLRLFSGLCLNR